ncbi:hypothetical protein D6D10_09738, partial [Aureobasidium pullulans]
MTSSRQSISDEPIVSPHRVSIGRGGRGNMTIAEHNRRRSSSWSLHSGNSG